MDRFYFRTGGFSAAGNGLANEEAVAALVALLAAKSTLRTLNIDGM